MAVLALIGSGEFLPWARAVDRLCSERSTASSDRALIVPTASAPEGEPVFRRWAEMGTEHYRSIGLEPVVLDLRERSDAQRPEIVDAVAGARVVFFSGGNPGYLIETVAATPFWDAVVDAVARGTAFGGCSAGAVAIGTLGPFVRELEVDHWVEGLGLLGSAYVAPHFDALESFRVGLTDYVLENCPAASRIVGLDEDTAILGDGERWLVVGTGAARFAPGLGPVARDDLVVSHDGEEPVVPLGLRLG